MTKEEVYNGIVEEIKTIREKATSEEKANLNKLDFERYSVTRCIYGLMTGHCSSNRAKELMPKSIDNYPKFTDNLIGFFGVAAMTNSKQIYTLLEMALFELSDYIINNIIDYIKEETDQLLLTIDDIDYTQHSTD